MREFGGGGSYPVRCPECGGENDTTLISKMAGLATLLVFMYTGLELSSRIWPKSSAAIYVGIMIGLLLSLRFSSFVSSLIPRLVKFKKPWF
jgi:hypothetical protein